MIFTERNITIRNDSATINAPVILYRGDKNVEVRFILIESPYKYSNRDSINIFESTDASYAQLVIKTPNDREPIFGDITAVGNNNVTFVIRHDMIDEIEEVGKYDFQIRLFDADQTSMATTPEVTGGFIIKEPIAKEDSNNNITNSAIVGSAVVTNDVEIPTFVGGSYNKTAWHDGDVISKQKLNKIENGMYETYELSKNNSSQIKEKADKNEVFTMANMGQDVKEAMTGGSVAVVGRNSILPENIVDGIISPSKTTFSIRNSQQLFDKDSANNLINKAINSTGNGVIETFEGRFVSHKINITNIEDGTNIGASCIFNNQTNYLNVIAFGDNDTFIKYNYRYVTKTSDMKYIRICGEIKFLDNCVVTTDIVGHEYLPYAYIDGNEIMLDNKFLKEQFNSISSLFNDVNINITKCFNFKSVLTSDDTIDKVLKNGFYIIQSPCSTVPVGFNSGFLLSFSDNLTMSIQIAISYDMTTVRAIRRVRSSSDISEWVDLRYESQLPSDPQLPLKNEKGLCMGDSITMLGKYPQYISEKTGGNFLNCGFAGTRISYNDNDNYKDISFIKLCEAIKNNNWTTVETACTTIDGQNGNVVYTNAKNRLKYANNSTANWDDVKYITLAYGTNDFAGNVTLDNESNKYDITTILGAFRQGIKYLQESHPTIKIYVFTPCFRSRINNGDNKNSDDYPNANRVYLNEICDAIESECKKLGIPCKNMYYSSQVNKYTSTIYLSDGLHRTEVGYKLLGEQYSKFILGN